MGPPVRSAGPRPSPPRARTACVASDHDGVGPSTCVASARLRRTSSVTRPPALRSTIASPSSSPSTASTSIRAFMHVTPPGAGAAAVRDLDMTGRIRRVGFESRSISVMPSDYAPGSSDATWPARRAMSSGPSDRPIHVRHHSPRSEGANHAHPRRSPDRRTLLDRSVHVRHRHDPLVLRRAVRLDVRGRRSGLRRLHQLLEGRRPGRRLHAQRRIDGHARPRGRCTSRPTTREKTPRPPRRTEAR